MIKKLVFFFLFITALGFGQQTNFSHFTTKDGLQSDVIYEVTQDEIGYLWIATANGLQKFDGDDFANINPKRYSTIESIISKIVAGSKNGLEVFGNKNQFLESKEILKIFPFDDDIFVGTSQGISIVKEDYLQPININPAINVAKISDIILSESSFYIATSKGLFQLNSLFNKPPLTKLNTEVYKNLISFDNELILANADEISTINPKSNQKKLIQRFENITSTIKIKNELWITSSTEGILILALPSFSFKQKINKYNFLQTNHVNSVFEDRQKNVWISTNKGLYKYKNTKQKSTKPEVFFESLLINNQKSDSLFENSERIKLACDENNISLSFKTVDFENSKKIQYRYAINDNFSDWSNSNRLQLASLQANMYKVSIQSKIDEEASDVKTFTFQIKQPFYKEFWFLLIVFISFLLILYLIIDARLKRIKEKNQLKIERLTKEKQLIILQQKALQLQMNPHFIFNVLNGIKALGNSNKTNEFNESVSKFSVLLRSMLNNSRVEEISLKEEINTLKNYLDLEKQMNSFELQYQINSDLQNIDADEILIPTMLIQPFAENCIKHAFQGKSKGFITIDFKVEKSFLYCSVIDDGVGFHQSQKTSSHTSAALQITKERLESITPFHGFSIKELNKNGEISGTKVSFKIPLKTDF